MKKGISQPMIAIILGIIFIVIVLLVFGNPLRNYVNTLFEKGPLKPVSKEPTYVAGGGQKSSNSCSPLLELKGNADSVAYEIAKYSYDCFSDVVKTRKTKHFCMCIISVDNDISRDLIEKHLGKYDKLIKVIINNEQDPVEALIENWEVGYDETRHTKLVKGSTYRICADADEVDFDDDDLIITGKDNCNAI